MLLDFEEVAVVDHACDHLFHIVRLVRCRGHNRVELCIGAINRIAACSPRNIVEIVRRDEANQLANHRQAFGVIMSHEVSYAGDLIMRRGPAELFLGDLFVRNGLDDVWSGDEHVSGLVDHEREVGDCRRIDSPACTRSHDG